MSGTRFSGRRRTPVAAKILAGTFRADRHGDQDDPTPPVGIPVPPHPLKGKAKGEWERMVARLSQNETLTVVDDAALYQYVQLWSETEAITADAASLRKLSMELRKVAIEKLRGDEVTLAIERLVDLERLAAASRTALRQGHLAIRQFLVEFGMTPSARTRVKKIPKKNGQMSKFERLMQMK